MMGRRSMVGGAAALASAGLGGCALQGPRYRYRYKLTLQVLADGVVHTGVNVVQVEWRLPAGPSEWRWPNAMAGAAVKGEANVVDFGGGRLLVALLTKRIPDPGETWEPGAARSGWGEASPEAVLARAYGLAGIKAVPEDERTGTSPFLEVLKRQRGPREIAPQDLPTLVAFRNAKDPLTVEQVDPQSLGNSLPSHPRFQSITIEICDEELTRKIKGFCPWLRGMTTYIDGTHYSHSNSLSNQLSADSFLRE